MAYYPCLRSNALSYIIFDLKRSSSVKLMVCGGIIAPTTLRPSAFKKLKVAQADSVGRISKANLYFLENWRNSFSKSWLFTLSPVPKTNISTLGSNTLKIDKESSLTWLISEMFQESTDLKKHSVIQTYLNIFYTCLGNITIGPRIVMRLFNLKPTCNKH